jgi:hypothetical protein
MPVTTPEPTSSINVPGSTYSTNVPGASVSSPTVSASLPGPTSTTNNPVTTNFDVFVQVIDGSHKPKPNTIVYFVSGSPDNSNIKAIHLTNTTDARGWTLFAVDYDLKKNDVIYFGASTDQSAVESDFTNKAFTGEGRIGYWKTIDHTMVNNSESTENAYASIAMYVNGDTGKLLD